jgi:hypothetical protein
MIRLVKGIHVDALSGAEIIDFVVNCNDEAYQRWWPGTHIQLRTVKGGAGEIDNLINMDEFIGKRRVRMTGEIIDLIPGKRMVWQARHGIRLAVKLILKPEDDEGGVRITPIIEAGYRGVGKILDPIFRLLFSQEFAAATDEHVRTNFPKLRDLLQSDQH